MPFHSKIVNESPCPFLADLFRLGGGVLPAALRGLMRTFFCSLGPGYHSFDQCVIATKFSTRTKKKSDASTAVVYKRMSCAHATYYVSTAVSGHTLMGATKAFPCDIPAALLSLGGLSQRTVISICLSDTDTESNSCSVG